METLNIVMKCFAGIIGTVGALIGLLVDIPGGILFMLMAFFILAMHEGY